MSSQNARQVSKRKVIACVFLEQETFELEQRPKTLSATTWQGTEVPLAGSTAALATPSISERIGGTILGWLDSGRRYLPWTTFRGKHQYDHGQTPGIPSIGRAHHLTRSILPSRRSLLGSLGDSATAATDSIGTTRTLQRDKRGSIIALAQHYQGRKFATGHVQSSKTPGQAGHIDPEPYQGRPCSQSHPHVASNPAKPTQVEGI